MGDKVDPYEQVVDYINFVYYVGLSLIHILVSSYLAPWIIWPMATAIHQWPPLKRSRWIGRRGARWTSASR